MPAVLESIPRTGSAVGSLIHGIPAGPPKESEITGSIESVVRRRVALQGTAPTGTAAIQGLN